MSGHGPRRDPGKERFWRRTLRRQTASGLSVREFCGGQGLTETTFHAWRLEIPRRDQEARQSKTLAQPAQSKPNPSSLSKKSGPGDRPRFLPVAVANLAAPSAVEIVLPSGIVLRVGRDCNRLMLRTVLSAVLREDAEEPTC